MKNVGLQRRHAKYLTKCINEKYVHPPAPVTPKEETRVRNDNLRTTVAGFDPEALERGAKALREIKNAQNSKKVRFHIFCNLLMVSNVNGCCISSKGRRWSINIVLLLENFDQQYHLLCLFSYYIWKHSNNC